MNKWFCVDMLYTPFSLIKEAIEQKIKAFCGSLKKWKKYANCAYMHQVQRLIQNNLITFETELSTRNNLFHGKLHLTCTKIYVNFKFKFLYQKLFLLGTADFKPIRVGGTVCSNMEYDIAKCIFL